MFRTFGSVSALCLLLVACSGSRRPVGENAAPEPAHVAGAPDATAAREPPAEAPAMSSLSTTRPQQARREERSERLFGVEVADPYRWLEDGASAEVRAWASAQHQHAQSIFAVAPEREALAARLKELIYVETLSPPVRRKNRWFFSKKGAQDEKAIVYWREGKKGPPQVLLDPHTFSDDGSVSIGVWVPSLDGKHVAYTLKENNSDEATLYVREVASGKSSVIDVIEGAKYASPSWTPDGRGFFYVRLPTDPAISAAERPGHGELRYHALGTDPKTDPVVREKTGDPTRYLGAQVTRDGKLLFLSIWQGWSRNDLWVRFETAAGKKRGFVPIAIDQAAVYNPYSHGGKIFIHTNEGAPRFRVFAVDPKKLERNAWKEIVPEDPAAVLDDLTIAGGQLALNYMKDASSQVRIVDPQGKKIRDVPLPTIGTAWVSGDPDDDEAYLGFSSFVHATEIQAMSVKTGATELYDRVEVPLDPSAFEVEQVRYPSKDGTPISMFLIGKKGIAKDGNRPTLLYGYGGFTISLTPSFWSTRIPWIERGGLFAVANLRGGGEYGEAWHQAGMRERKQNVFDDFIAAAEWLISERYTRRGRLAIEGGSNGGLLVGAAMTQRPELFGAVLAGAPLFDMVRYPLFGGGKLWIPEYGDPTVEADFKTLLAYSPYHHVVKGTAYPPLLVASADSDDRVDPLHARKFVAAVQHATTGVGPHLLRIESKAGHAGADMRRAAVQLAADQLAFLVATIAPAPGLSAER